MTTRPEPIEQVLAIELDPGTVAANAMLLALQVAAAQAPVEKPTAVE